MNEAPPAVVVAEIRAELARQRMSTATLAERTNLSPHQMGRRLSGKSPITLAELCDIADALGLEAWALLKRAAA